MTGRALDSTAWAASGRHSVSEWLRDAPSETSSPEEGSTKPGLSDDSRVLVLYSQPSVA